MLKITDKKFQYTPSFDTDLKAKFRKIIAAQKKAAAKPSSVVPYKKREAK